jgi:hypothetical protein
MSGAKDAMGATEAAPDLEIVGNQVTIHPTGFKGGPEKQDGDFTERNLVGHMARFRANPFDFFREVSLFVSGTGWRAYDSVIGQPIFYPGFSDRLKTLVLESPLLQGKIRELAEVRLKAEELEGLLGTIREGIDEAKLKRRSELEGNLREVVDNMMDNMISKMDSKTFVRGAYYGCTQLLTRAYHQGEAVSPATTSDLADIGRHPHFQRGSLASEVRCRRSEQEKTVNYLLALSQVPCRLCLAANYLLSPWNWPAYRGRRQ